MAVRRVCALFLCLLTGTVIGQSSVLSSILLDKEGKSPPLRQREITLGWLWLKPNSNNLDYAYFVSGTQPLHQSWHAQLLSPNYAPAYELGVHDLLPQSTYPVSVDWLHLQSQDDAFKQASQNTDLSTVEFVGPPFQLSPPVFGIKRANSLLYFTFDDVTIHVKRDFDQHPRLQTSLFGGLNILNVKQTIDTVFTDYAGSPATPYSYALPADPSYYFQLQSMSHFVGAGPDLGLHVTYEIKNGFFLVGQAQGSLNTGTLRVEENFTAQSANLTANGIGTSQQYLTIPHRTQVVPGFDGKLGGSYHYARQGAWIAGLTVEGGYRMASYLNAISTIAPSAVVPPNAVSPAQTPEFATGTMAIASVDLTDRPFNMNGPYVNLTITMN